MRLLYTNRFLRSYAGASPEIRKAFDRRAAFLAKNLLHPSLHSKKYDESQNIWQARITRDWRIYFRIDGQDCYLIDLVPHPK